MLMRKDKTLIFVYELK